MEKLKIKQMVDKYKYYALAILIGVFLMLFSFGGDYEETIYTDTFYEDFSIQAELCEILSLIDGVGRVSVMVTTLETGESEYLQDTKSSYDDLQEDVETETILVSKQGGVEEPIKIKNTYPLYKGALIVCDGGDSSLVKLEITNAVSSLLGISSDKINIIKMKE